MQAFLPGYEQDIEPGAGLPVYHGGDKLVVHTTEGAGRGSYAGVRNLWRGPANWGRGLPHFLADGARVVQLLPLTVNAYTMENKAGGADINKAGHVVQVEWCRRAADPWEDDELTALAKLLADICKAGLAINCGNHPRFYGADAGFTLASYTARQRMGAGEWTNFSGWCGHQHAPENAHWDPGFLDAGRVVNLARQFLGEHEQESEVPSFIAWRTSGPAELHGAYEVDGLFARNLSPDDVQALRYLGVADKGVLPANFWSLKTRVPREVLS